MKAIGSNEIKRGTAMSISAKSVLFHFEKTFKIACVRTSLSFKERFHSANII